MNSTGGYVFDEFYKQYPRKVARMAAQKAWDRLTPEQREEAKAALPKHIAYWQAKGQEWEFLPHCSTWLNQQRWTDELPALNAAPPKQAVAWWSTDQGIIAKGREIGVHARPGEDMAAYKARVVEAMRRAA